MHPSLRAPWRAFRPMRQALAALAWPLAAALLAGWLWAAPARAAGPEQVVGMVLDVQGSGELKQGAETGKLQLLSYLKPGAQLRLDAGAHASVSHYGARLIYKLSGPVLAQIDADGIRVLKGAAAVTKSLAEKVALAALNPNMGAAAFKMRALPPDVVLAAPSPKTVLLTRRPQFRWIAPESVSYQFTLTELPSRELARVPVDGAAWELPPGQQLAYDKDYSWTVSYTSAADGRARSTSAEFRVAPQADADELLALRPDAGAGVDEWVQYAAILSEFRAFDDICQVKRKLAAQRPELAKTLGTVLMVQQRCD